MFSRSIIDANITAVHKKLCESAAAKGLSQPAFPTYHSTGFVDTAVDYIDSAWKTNYDTGERYQDRPYSQEELDFIENERLLCKLDFGYWVSRYVKIKNEEERIVKMQFWTSQEIFLAILSEMEQERIAIMLQILKARQLGISRVISLVLLHSVNFSPNVNAFMASSNEEKTVKLFAMVDIVRDRLPFWMRVEHNARREGKFIQLDNNSAVTLQHGQQTTGIARGTTPTVAHLSELAEFDDPGAIVDSALLRAMHDSVYTKLFLEGTAEGQNNWWHDKWKSTKAGWPQRRSRLRPLFLPWFVGGLYPKVDWLRAHPVPADYSSKMLPWAYKHARMAEEYVRSSATLSKHLGSNWIMPLEQIWYYECERDEAIRQRSLNKFLQEMPANDDEAFQSTNHSAFETEVIIAHRDHCHTASLAGVYGLRGPAGIVPERLQPAALSIDPTRPEIPVTAHTPNSGPIQFAFVPLRFDGWSVESEDSTVPRIFIWDHPEDYDIYGFGVDTSMGVGRDNTVIQGLRKGGLHGPAKQIAELACSSMNSLDAVPFVLALSTYYTVRGEDGEMKQPRLAIECKSGGEETQLKLRMLGCRNFHPRTDRRGSDRQMQMGNAQKIGIHTDHWFRSGALELLIKQLRDFSLEICSPGFVKEMASMEADDFHQQLRAGKGSHDDRIMSMAFILVSLYRLDPATAVGLHAGLMRAQQAHQERMASGQSMLVRQYAKWQPGPQEGAVLE